MRRAFAVAICFLTAGPVYAGGLPPAQFQDLAAVWHCNGVFPASGKTLLSTVRFDWNAASGVLVKHHDDAAEPGYHAVELWAALKDGTLRDTIADSFSGVRDFTSSGWAGNTLTWQGETVGSRTERFVYTKVDAATLRIDWDVSSDGATYKTGDTLSCKRA